MKSLKFESHLADRILAGKKTITWRVNDDKNLSCWDEIILIRRPELIQFGKAKILWAKETTFGVLTEEDCEGHEKFASEEEMYKTYSNYFKMEVKPETKLKVVKFKLI